jgi:hypothetical protein
VSTTEQLLARKSSGSGVETKNTAVGDPPRWPRDIPLSAQVGTNLADKRRSLTPTTAFGSVLFCLVSSLHFLIWRFFYQTAKIFRTGALWVYFEVSLHFIEASDMLALISGSKNKPSKKTSPRTWAGKMVSPYCLCTFAGVECHIPGCRTIYSHLSENLESHMCRSYFMNGCILFRLCDRRALLHTNRPISKHNSSQNYIKMEKNKINCTFDIILYFLSFHASFLYL